MHSDQPALYEDNNLIARHFGKYKDNKNVKNTYRFVVVDNALNCLLRFILQVNVQCCMLF